MNILERHVGFEWSKWFLLSLIFFFSLFLVTRITDDSNFLSTADWKKLLLWFIDYLPWLLPLSCLCSTLLTLSFMGLNGEWLGLRTCAVSSVNCFRIIFVVGFGLTFLSWITWQVEDYFLDQQSDSSRKIDLTSGFQMKIGTSRAWYFENFDSTTKEGKNLQLYCYDDQGNDAFRIRAKSAYWKNNRWIFHQGRFLGFSSLMGIPTIDAENNGMIWEEQPDGLQRIKEKSSPKYSKFFQHLTLDDLQDDPTTHLLLKKKPNLLSNKQISLILENYPNQSSSVLFPFLLRSAHIRCSLVTCLLAIFCGLMIGASNSPPSFGKIIVVTLLGITFFYLVRTFFDTLGERGIVNHWVAAGSPYAAVLLLSVFYRLNGER